MSKEETKEVTLRFVIGGAVTTELPKHFKGLNLQAQREWATEYLRSLSVDDILESIVPNIEEKDFLCEAIEDNENDYQPLVPNTKLWEAYQGEEV